MRIFVKYLSKFSGFLFLLFLLGIWTFISSGPEWSSQYLFPSPKAIVDALLNSREELLRSAGASLLKLVPAYFAAAFVGISLGIVSGSVPWVGNMLKPISRFAAPIPPNVYIPYAIAILPTFYLSSTFIIFIAAFVENCFCRKPSFHIFWAFRRHGAFVHYAHCRGTFWRKYGAWAFCAVLCRLFRLPQHGGRNPLDGHCGPCDYGTF